MPTTSVDSRREQLLDAAVRAFVTAGYTATRVSDIVSEAGVAQGTFYLYFASKSQIFRQLVERFLTMLFDNLVSASGDEPSDLSMFRKISRARVLFTLQTCYENRELSRIYFQEATGAIPELNSRLLEFNRLVAQSLETRLQYGIQLGYLRAHNTRVVSTAMVGVVEQVVRHSICFSDDEIDLESLADDIIDFEIGGISANITQPECSGSN